MKRVIAIILAAVMVFGTTAVFAESFNDIDGHWAKADIISAQEKGIVNGDGTGAFRPNDTVTRAEFVKMLSAVVVKKMGASDVPSGLATDNTWYSKYYNFALSYYLIADSENAVDGIYPGVFSGDDATVPVKRWEMAYMTGSLIKILLNKELTTAPTFADIAEVDAFPGEVPAAIKVSAENGIIKGNNLGQFNGFGTGTRAEAAVISLRVDTLIDNYIAEQTAKQEEELKAMIKSFDDNRVTYADSEIPKSNVKVKFEMENGKTFTVELYPKEAPQTVANFVKLVNDGFYNGLSFHRVIDGFVAQGGDPNGDGSGGRDKYIFGEFKENGFEGNTLTHKEGTISMARSSLSNNSASSQFFICYADQPSLDGSYAAFGKVVDGMDTVKAFLEVDRKISVSGEVSIPSTPIIIKKASVVK